MAYENLELIQVFSGAKSEFTPASYKDKLVLVTGNPNAATNADKDPYIYAIDGAGNYKAFRLPHSFVRGIKATAPEGIQNESDYVEGLLEFVGANGVIVSRAGGTITIDASSLNTKVNQHEGQINNISGIASQAKADSASALAKIGTLVGTTTGDDAKSARTIAEEEANKVKEEILGTSGEGDSISKLREDVDEVTEAVETLNGNETVVGSVDKKIKDAINKFATDVSNDNTINTLKELIDYVAGVDGSKDLASALAQIEENKGKIETLNGNASTAGSVDKKVKDAIDAEVLRANGAYATKAQGEKADSAIQSVTTTTPDYTEVTVPTGEGADSKNKVVNVKTTTMQQAMSADLGGATVKGVVPTQDIYEFLKARLSVKVV